MFQILKLNHFFSHFAWVCDSEGALLGTGYPNFFLGFPLSFQINVSSARCSTSVWFVFCLDIANQTLQFKNQNSVTFKTADLY
jgi:hypothetical protein